MKSYRICQSKIVYEVLNTEVIIVDFSTGNYYALIHIAKQIWQLIEQQGAVDQIAQLLSDRYLRAKEAVLADLELFLEELVNNGLIEESDSVPVQIVNLSSSLGWEYDIPKLQKYTDVQSLLLLDPIHEVSEVGWPAQLN
jgi:hypothetical protein